MRDKYSLYIQKYTDYNENILNKINNYMYKNIWNFIVIKWNICMDILEDKIKISKYEKINICLLNNITESDFYNLLDNFIGDNIMKIKFSLICINKYLS